MDKAIAYDLLLAQNTPESSISLSPPPVSAQAAAFIICGADRYNLGPQSIVCQWCETLTLSCHHTAQQLLRIRAHDCLHSGEKFRENPDGSLPRVAH